MVHQSWQMSKPNHSDCGMMWLPLKISHQNSPSNSKQTSRDSTPYVTSLPIGNGALQTQSRPSRVN